MQNKIGIFSAAYFELSWNLMKSVKQHIGCAVSLRDSVGFGFTVASSNQPPKIWANSFRAKNKSAEQLLDFSRCEKHLTSLETWWLRRPWRWKGAIQCVASLNSKSKQLKQTYVYSTRQSASKSLEIEQWLCIAIHWASQTCQKDQASSKASIKTISIRNHVCSVLDMLAICH